MFLEIFGNVWKYLVYPTKMLRYQNMYVRFSTKQYFYVSLHLNNKNSKPLKLPDSPEQP